MRPTEDKVNVMNVVASTAMGGADRVVLSLASAIDRDRLNCRFCVFVNFRRGQNDLYEMIRQGANDVVAIEIGKNDELRQLWQFVNVVRTNRIHVLHTHGYRSDILGLLVAKILGIPIVSTVHGWTSATEQLRRYEMWQRHALKYFDVVIAVSEDIRQILIAHGVAPQRVVKLHNAINVDAYSGGHGGRDFRQEIGIGPHARLVGAVGRLSVEKGLEYLLKACAQLIAKNRLVKLLVVGDGPQRQELEALAKSLGISEDVIFCGHRSDVHRIYPALDVYAIPSLTEGMPIALLEAMVFGRSVVASRVGGIPEVVQDGVTGFLVPPRDVDQLAEKMWDILQSPNIAADMGRRAKKCVESLFDVREWIKKIEGIYLGLTKPT
jgi:glycosyltransferase involved in cell wall biosynthesis